MEQLKVNGAHRDLMDTPIKDSLYNQCRVMLDHAMKTGKPINSNYIESLNGPPESLSQEELVHSYNYLAKLIKPAMPGTLILFEKNRQSKSPFRFLGPLPIVRGFMLVTIISLLTLIGISLSPMVNNESMQLSMLQGNGWGQAARLAFLLSAASVGGSFYALFKMNSFVKQGSFDMKYAPTYWSRYVLGLVAGILLSELFVVFFETVPAQSGTSSNGALQPLASAPYLIKPIFAILGGFSANLMYRILNRFIDMVESLFKGTTDEMIAQKKKELVDELDAQESRLKADAVNDLLSIKDTLIKNNATDGVMEEIDKALSQALSTADIPTPHKTKA